jgi:hypothetical protein
MECAKNWGAPLLISFDSNDRTKPKNMKTKITVLLAFAMFVVSVSAGTTKKGYVFSISPAHVAEFMSYIGKHDMAAAARMIKEKKVIPLKEGVDVVLVPNQVQKLGSAPLVGFKLRDGKVVYWTADDAIWGYRGLFRRDPQIIEVPAQSHF